jgi:hypothetical protein
MSRNESRNESRVPRVRVLVFEAGSETPMHTLSLPAAASVFDLRGHIGLFGPQLWDPRFNGGLPVGDGVRLLDLENDEREVRLEVRVSRLREPAGPPTASLLAPAASARSIALRPSGSFRESSPCPFGASSFGTGASGNPADAVALRGPLRGPAPAPGLFEAQPVPGSGLVPSEPGPRHPSSRSSSSRATVRPLALVALALVAGLIAWRAKSGKRGRKGSPPRR